MLSRSLLAVTGVSFIFIFLLNSCDNSRLEDSTIDSYKKVSVISNNGDTLSGKGYEVYVSTIDTSKKMLKYYWGNGQLQAQSFFRNNKKEGRWLTYFDNGILSSEGNFLDDKKNGEFRIYHRNGNLSIIEKYSNGIKVRGWHYYDTSGKEIKVKHNKY